MKLNKKIECSHEIRYEHSKWWAGVDSNHRSRRRQIYSLLPLATREPTHIKFKSVMELVDGLEPPTC